MEYPSGGSLVTQVQQVQVFMEERAQFYAAEITLALEFLHKRGILHQ
jgi:novel protein kinase C epsilon type